jgi:hypothetical protein
MTERKERNKGEKEEYEKNNERRIKWRKSYLENYSTGYARKDTQDVLDEAL